MSRPSSQSSLPRALLRRAAPIAALLAVLPPLAGCISFGPATPKQLIGLSAENTAPPGELGAGNQSRAIIVLDPETDRDLDVLRVPVQVTPATVAYIKDASWIEKPARQFRSLLAETIRAKNRVLVFEGLSADTGTQRVLSGRLLTMGYDAASGAIVVRYDALLTAPDGEVRLQRFEARRPGVAPTPAAVSPALNRAANDIAGQVAAWLATLPPPPPPPSATAPAASSVTVTATTTSTRPPTPTP